MSAATARALAAAKRSASGLCAACAVLGVSCGYPEFKFVAGGQNDSTSDDVATPDVDARDESIDSQPIDSTTTDSVVDSANDTTKIDWDAGVDAPVDTSPESDGFDPCSLIDDLEDGDGRIVVHCGRNGTWYIYNDGSDGGVQTPPAGVLPSPTMIPGGRGSSVYAMRTHGSGFTGDGARMGLNYIDGTSYDASAWSGIAFWARVETGTNTSVRVELADGDTDRRGGVCTAAGKTCDDHFGVDLTFDTTWKYYVVKYVDLKQVGWGTPFTSYDPKRAYGLDFHWRTPAAFDVWIDDLYFVP